MVDLLPKYLERLPAEPNIELDTPDSGRIEFVCD